MIKSSYLQNDLREIPEQIKNLEEKLRVLRNEKQALFLKLKKVVNEDVNRKRQLKEKFSNEISTYV